MSTPKGQVLRTKGTVVIFDRKFLAGAASEAKQKAIVELECSRARPTAEKWTADFWT